MNKVEDYEEAFKQIKEATNIEDIKQLVEQFEEAETNNFSLLKYVESLSQEIKELDDEIKEIKQEIDKYWPGVLNENGWEWTL